MPGVTALLPTALENGGPALLSIGRLLSPGADARLRALSQLAAAGLLALVVTAGVGSAAWASDGASTPVLDAGNDGSCDTRPTTYPADGEPVPDTAGCALLTDDSGAVVGEVWSWADSDTVQWYSYVAATVGEPPVGGSVVMCGSTDTGQAGDTYPCSPDSTYLLFTVAGVFVEWPNALATDLYYCQLTAFGEGGTAVLGRACGTVHHFNAVPPGDDGDAAGASPSATPTPSEQPSEPDPSPSATPTDSPSDDESTTGPSSSPDTDPPGATTGAPEDPPVALPTTELPSGAVPSQSASVADAGSTTSPTATSSTGAGASGDSRAIDSESVARVGGSPVPMGLLLVLAAALALGGYLMLAGPAMLSTFVAARRQRR